MSKHILFVDDDSNVLKGIKRMFFDIERPWEVFFSNSPTHALALMAKTRVDLIVSDMVMPEMSGAELLQKVKEIYPDTVRFVLSGNNKKELILKSVAPADQYFSKPCSPEELIGAIDRIFEVEQIAGPSAKPAAEEPRKKVNLQSFISKLKVLPTLPKLYEQLRDCLDSPRSSFKDIAKIIKQDMTMTAKILQLVNSSFFAIILTLPSLRSISAFFLSTPKDALNSFSVSFDKSLISSNGL